MKRTAWFLGVLFIILTLWFIGMSFGTKPKTPLDIPPEASPVTSPTPSIIPSEANIRVVTPRENTIISSPFTVRGEARVFENIVSIRLIDDLGKVLFEGFSEAQSPDIGQYGDFQTEIPFSTTRTEGKLEVYQASAKDGSEIDKVTVPLNFR